MVSFQTPFLEMNQRKAFLDSDTGSKKRKWEHESDAVHEEVLPYKHWKTSPKVTAVEAVAAAETAKSFSDVELHLETPLPSEWQRCLDIQSGEIHFYNIRTQKRTLRDPRESTPPPTTTEPTSPRDCHMSLDLELNLPCGSLNHKSPLKSSTKETNSIMKKTSSSPPVAAAAAAASPPCKDFFKCLTSTVEKKRLSADSAKEDDDQAAEMVAAACMRCHMLVMLQKSSPTCPNCKYVHPPYQSPPELFKPKLSLSC